MRFEILTLIILLGVLIPTHLNSPIALSDNFVLSCLEFCQIVTPLDYNQVIYWFGETMGTCWNLKGLWSTS